MCILDHEADSSASYHSLSSRHPTQPHITQPCQKMGGGEVLLLWKRGCACGEESCGISKGRTRFRSTFGTWKIQTAHIIPSDQFGALGNSLAQALWNQQEACKIRQENFPLDCALWVPPVCLSCRCPLTPWGGCLSNLSCGRPSGKGCKVVMFFLKWLLVPVNGSKRKPFPQLYISVLSVSNILEGVWFCLCLIRLLDQHLPCAWFDLFSFAPSYPKTMCLSARCRNTGKVLTHPQEVASVLQTLHHVLCQECVFVFDSRGCLTHCYFAWGNSCERAEAGQARTADLALGLQGSGSYFQLPSSFHLPSCVLNSPSSPSVNPQPYGKSSVYLLWGQKSKWNAKDAKSITGNFFS